MANKTIALTSELYSGTTGMKLYLLHPTAGTIGNGAGDALTEGANGLFTATVTEAITGWWRVLVTDSSDGPLIEGGWVYIPSDTESTYVVDDPSLMSTISTNVTTLLGRITADVYTMFTNLIAMITGTGATAQWTTKALENNPNVTVVAAPIGAEDVERVIASEIRSYTGEKGTVTVTIRDANAALVDLTGKTLRMVFSINGNVVHRMAHGDLDVSGSTVTFSKNLSITGGPGEVEWSLFEVDKDALGHGVMYVTKIPY